MRRTNTRSITIARRTDGVQPASIIATLSLAAMLTLAWVGMVTAWPGLH